MSASPIDLTTLDNVKQWLSSNGVSSTNDADDDEIQACITAWSAIFVWQTGMGPLDGSTVIESPFVTPIAYNETYDGPGGSRMFLRHKPIVTVTQLTIGPYQVPPSTSWGIAGYVVDGTFSSIALRNGGTSPASASNFWGFWGLNFPMGVANINVQYTAGYASTPVDLELAARKTAALNYKRKSWIGLKQKALGSNAGSTVYTEFEYDPDVARLIANYTRWAVV